MSLLSDCLHIQLYRDSKERCKNGPTKASLSLEEFLGMETGFTLDKESNTMALICSELVVVLAFDNRELLIQWQVKIRANLVEEQQFLVQIAHVPTKSKLPCGPTRLHLQDHTFCLVSGVPPRLLGTWPLKELRRFGVVEGKFCFEGGSLCGRGEGLHVLLTNQSEELAQAMDLASKGKLLGKRKTLSRKNSVLETSSRFPLHKRSHHDSGSKSTTGDSNRPLLSSGSEGSTCDACSEILRSTDPCGDDHCIYSSSSASMKASSCRIHYRWPSCLSRWGQSSTTTASDVESMDTVSVTLSDFQGPSHSPTISKSNGHGQSLSCLCDGQGTWPKSVQHAVNGSGSSKPGESKRTNMEHPFLNQSKTENCVLCPCHEPINDWINSSLPQNSQEKVMNPQECACWSKLSMSVRNEVDVRMVNGRKSASANASPSSSPKKTKYNTGPSTMRPMNNSSADSEMICSCGANDPYANYATPKSAIMHSKDMSAMQSNGCKDAKVTPAGPAEDYDVPKKFSNMLPHCDMIQKTQAIKSVANGSSCSCMSACNVIQNIELFKMASNHPFNHKYGPTNSSGADALQMCACQRVMLWAGSLVPCLGPQRASLDKGWQCSKSLKGDSMSCSRTWYNHTVAVCNEPHKTAELVMVNGKMKHVIRGSSMDTCTNDASHVPTMGQQIRPRSSTVSYPITSNQNEKETASINYVNIEFPNDENDRTVKVSEDGSTVNYANIEFAETLSLYENSNLVLSRLEDENRQQVCSNKPPLPPRSQTNGSCKSTENTQCQQCKGTCNCKQLCFRRSPKKTLQQVNGSAYEMMCYTKNPEEDYLLMQPICSKNEKHSPSKQNQTQLDCFQNDTNCSNQTEKNEEPENSPSLPLRPFMPYSYPVTETNGTTNITGNPNELSRKNQLINEELHLRSMRSNSLSELKKKVLMRKRSSSVDGKNNGYITNDSGAEVESLPASPVCSPRHPVHRKNSLFSKLNLRSKEKSMSSNEIAPPIVMPNGTSLILNNIHKNGLHRSADCLKLNEEYANSDDELNSDNSDFTIQKETASTTCMKRSSSVPCRAGIASTVIASSPVRTSGTIMEMNDLNKDSTTDSLADASNETEDITQRKYSLDSHERSKPRVANGVRSNCDNVYRQECLDECDTLMEMQAVLRRHPNHLTANERGTDSSRSATSSCSSSDISDYMESLSFISRSSSSSSGSTCSTDYIRSEELYGIRSIPKPPPKNNISYSNSITVPSVHQSRYLPVESNGLAPNHRSPVENGDSSSAGTSSSSSYQDCRVFPRSAEEARVRPSTAVTSNRSSTSSTSSLSTSPSVTDYSSSTSSSPPCQNVLQTRGVLKGVNEQKVDEAVASDHKVFTYSRSKNEPRKL
ncbi:serine-rich adhesin for platelets-like [Uloborus diversus]|uniref:serine-rich adhesin for platelets-like n=1 Tax=Uloborus diversus TaxID=327109 RepID=UPI0024098414|nr:serine-rich adhesin for platelets-like [Uloborus diversus]